jgi:general transcription factor 3C polypeptide 4
LILGEACLAYGVADGSVGLVKITECLQPLSSVYSFGPEYSVATVFEAQECKPSTADQRGITALSWIEILGAVVSGPMYTWELITMLKLPL